MVAHPAPAFLGGDLPEKEQLAVQEGHDADIPSNEGVARDTPAPRSKDSHAEFEKEQERSSTSSVHEPERDLEKAGIETTAEEQEPHDPNIVDWDGPDDPANPVNWSMAAKWSNIAVLSALTLLTPLASSMFAPGKESMCW